MNSKGSIFHHKGLKREKKNTKDYPRAKYPLVVLFVDMVYDCSKRLVCGHFLLTNSCQNKKKERKKFKSIHSLSLHECLNSRQLQ